MTGRRTAVFALRGLAVLCWVWAATVAREVWVIVALVFTVTAGWSPSEVRVGRVES
jgi:hypothetical protein